MSIFKSSDMSTDLHNLGLRLAPAVALVEGSIKLYRYIAGLIAHVEDTYSDTMNGPQKKDAVLKAAEALATQVISDWPSISSDVSAWIDDVIGAYNTFKQFESESK